MSMYNLACGPNTISTVLLEMLGLLPTDIPRFRDCYIDDSCIVIYTRTGGGNREAYVTENASMQAHPLYIKDEDDAMDCTYANFFFSIPEEHKELIQKLVDNNLSITPAEKWELIFKQLDVANIK